MSPLIELLKNKLLSFSKEYREQFDQVNITLGKHELVHPNFAQAFYLKTDASKIGLGVELYKIDKDERRTIALVSCVLNVAEWNYSITELELLPIVFAC